MKQNKPVSLWWAVATYYISTILIGIVGAIIWWLVLVPYVLPTELFGNTTLPAIWTFIFTWLGVMYAAHFVKSTYELPDLRKVAKWATITYAVILVIGYALYIVFPDTEVTSSMLIQEALVSFVDLVIFCIAGRIYLK